MNEKTNPANENPVSKIPENFIPMSAPTQRLQVPERDGYVRYWFRGDSNRIQRAMQAGYTFVKPEDVKVNNFDLGGDSSTSGNSDLGTRVSVSAGDTASADGSPGRLYLMEVRQELYNRAQELLQERNDQVAQALRAGLLGADGEGPADKKARYTTQGVPDLFNPNKRRR